MDLFSLVATLTLDKSKYKVGLNEAEKEANGFAGRVGSTLNSVVSGLGKAAAVAAKVTATGIAASSGAVVALTKQAATAYGDYQQLEGGVKKLYGNMGMSLEEYAKDQGKTIDQVRDEWSKLDEAQRIVMDNADRAYATAGMSANRYMEVATSFSASLIKSLGGDTVAAANQTDVAMKAISDNWNTFGGDLGMIQNAYQGFAKQNYMMLDNLKLGYGGTKEEMLKLIDDANEYAKSIGQASDLSIDSFSDIVTAIDLIQQKQHIAGTTAREATETLSGSLNMLKASWENLVTVFGDPNASLAELEVNIDNVVTSLVGSTDESGEHIKGFLDNLFPIVQKSVESIAEGITKIAPVIAEKLPAIIEALVPSIIEGGTKLAIALGQGILVSLPAVLKAVIKTVLDSLGIGDTVTEFMSKVEGPVISSFDKIKTSLVNAFNRIKAVISPITDAFDEYVSSGGLMNDITNLIVISVGLLSDAISVASDFIATIVEKIGEFVDWLNSGQASAEAFKAVIVGITAAFTAYELVTNASTAASIALAAAQKGLELAQKGVAAAQQILNAVMSANPLGIVLLAVTALTAGFIYLWNTNEEFRAFFINAWQSICDFFSGVGEEIGAIVDSIVAWFTSIPEKLNAMKEGIGQKWQEIRDSASEMWDNIKKAISDKITEALKVIKEKLDGIKKAFKDKVTEAKTWGSDLIQGFIDGLKEKWESLKETLKGVAQSIKNILGFSEPKEGPLSNFHTYAPDMMDLFMKGINDNKDKLLSTVSDAFNFRDLISGPEITGSGSGVTTGNQSSSGSAVGTNVYNINVNQPVATPSEMAAQIRLESQYGLIRGEVLA